jgi:hypothetical protein
MQSTAAILTASLKDLPREQRMLHFDEKWEKPRGIPVPGPPGIDEPLRVP